MICVATGPARVGADLVSTQTLAIAGATCAANTARRRSAAPAVALDAAHQGGRFSAIA